MTMTPTFSRILLAGLLAVSPMAAQQNIFQRPAGARAFITGSPNLRDGTYALTGTAGICGELPTKTFVVEFANDHAPANSEISAIAFGSQQLVGGSTKASLFRLNVGVKTAKGGQPAAYVLNTDPPKQGNAGVATLTIKGNVTTLHVAGRDDMGEQIDLTVTCR